MEQERKTGKGMEDPEVVVLTGEFYGLGSGGTDKTGTLRADAEGLGGVGATILPGEGGTIIPGVGV